MKHSLTIFLACMSLLEPIGRSAGALAASPEASITRAEFITQIMQDVYADDPDYDACFTNIAPDPREKLTYTHLFADVPKTTAYAHELCFAMFTGLVHADRRANFRPEDPVTFVEAAKIITKAYGIAPLPSLRPDPTVPWYEPYRYAVALRSSMGQSEEKLGQPMTQTEIDSLLRDLRKDKPKVGFRHGREKSKPVTWETVREKQHEMRRRTQAMDLRPSLSPTDRKAIRMRGTESLQLQMIRRTDTYTPGSYAARLLSNEARSYRPRRR